MKKITYFLFLFLSLSVFSQEEDAWVYFTDKPNATTQLNTPLNFLTQRALDRRANQGIALQVNDVPVYQPYIDQIAAATGITVKAKSKWLNCLHIRGSVANINALTSFSFVASVDFADASLNSRLSTPRTIIPINKQMEVQTTFNYGDSNNQIEMLNGHILHQANFTGTGKIIAVLDSGFINVNSTSPFQRLFDNNLILGGYNYVSQNTDLYSLHNHGTLTLSCMGGFVDGELVGTAPDANYYLFVTEDVLEENPVEESYWVEAAEEADRLGADIISTSLGYYGYDNPSYSHVYTNMTGNEAFASKGANLAFSKGMIVVASAGNSGNSTEPLNHISVPAEATNVLAVGAVRFDETYAPFSSVGPGYLNRVKPDVMAKGQAATVANTSGTIQTASGTSFSCPIMAGMIASFWQAVPNLTNQQVIDFVKQSSDRFSNPTVQFGYGIPDFQWALNMALLSTNENQLQTISFFPNPTKDIISITFSSGFDTAKLTIFNTLGQEITSKMITQPNTTVSLEDLQSGIYIYTIVSANANQTGKIIKK